MTLIPTDAGPFINWIHFCLPGGWICGEDGGRAVIHRRTIRRASRLRCPVQFPLVTFRVRRPPAVGCAVCRRRRTDAASAVSRHGPAGKSRAAARLTRQRTRAGKWPVRTAGLGSLSAHGQTVPLCRGPPRSSLGRRAVRSVSGRGAGCPSDRGPLPAAARCQARTGGMQYSGGRAERRRTGACRAITASFRAIAAVFQPSGPRGRPAHANFRAGRAAGQV